MTWDHGVRLIDTAAWPVVVVVVLIIFGATIKRFLADARAITLKGAGFEASIVDRESITAAGHLGAAFHDKRGSGEQPKELPEIAPLIVNTSSPRARKRLHQSIVLWVDGHPERNIHERRALEALGVQVDLAKDSQEALRKLAHKEYELVISGMEQPSGKQAGYEL